MAHPTNAAYAMAQSTNQDFPCSLTLHVPLPTPRLANVALKAIQVDPELSPLVQRKLSVVQDEDDNAAGASERKQAGAGLVLLVEYRATTNRMLRVAVNSFMDSLKLVLEVMEKLDSDVLSIDTQEQHDAPS